MRKRTYLLAATGLSGLVVAASVGLADTSSAKLTPKAQAAVQKFAVRKALQTEPQKASGLRANKPDTGIDPVDAAASRQLRRAAVAPQTLTGHTTTLETRKDGSLKATLGDEFLKDVVVTRNADGTLSRSHQNHTANPTFTPAPAPEKE